MNIQQVDVGRALGTVSGLETNALNNKYRQTQMDAQQAQNARVSALSQAAPNALKGDPAALDTVAQLDPELFMKMDSRQRDIVKQKTEDLAAILYASKQHPDKYAEIRQYAIDKHGLDPRTIPEQYDEAFIDTTAAQVIGIGKMLEQTKDKAGNFKSFTDKNTGETFQMNMNNPADVQMIEKNQGNWLPTPTRQEQGGPGSFGQTKKQYEDLTDVEISTKNAIATANDLMKKIDENPDLLQTSSGIAQFAAGVGSEIRTAARVAGVDIPDEITNIAAYEDTFAELGIENKIAKGMAFDLALSYAAASGLGTGKALTDKDIKLALQRIGAGGLDTPAARKAAIKDVQRVLARNFKTRYETITKKPYEGDLGVVKDTGKDFSTMSLEELKSLDVNGLSPEEGAAAYKRWEELNRE